MDAKPCRVLQIESDDDDAALVEEMLRRVEAMRFELERAASLSEGRQLLGQQANGAGPEVVLANLSLPDSRGLCTLERIQERARGVPVVVLVEPRDRELGQEAVRRGAQDCLVRGEITPYHIASSLHHSVERNRVQDRLRGSERMFRALFDSSLNTAQKEMCARLAQADRMASVGTLASGVGHEINNPLTYVLYNAECIVQDLPGIIEGVGRAEHAAAGLGAVKRAAEPEDRGRDRSLADALRELLALAEDVVHGARRVREIVRALKTFSNTDLEQQAPVQINNALECALEITHNEVKRRARVVRAYGEAPDLLANAGQLSQVFLNLILNAAHSIDEGAPSSNEIHLCTRLEGEELRVEIRDTGRGIPAEHLPRVFEPFFAPSTREPGQGPEAGLGLWICQNIVRSYGGRIEVQSTVGEGSCFTVRLPLQPGSGAVVEDRERCLPDAADQSGADACCAAGSICTSVEQ